MRPWEVSMFRQHWDNFENEVSDLFESLRDRFVDGFSNNTEKVKDALPKTPEEFSEKKEDFVNWGKEYIENLKQKMDSEKISKTKDNFFVLLRNLGVNEELLRETFQQNKKEILDPMIGELVAILALVLGWQQKDKEAFSQALGEIGVIGVFTAKPFICLIAICGLAYGYHKNFHKEAFKKGGVLGLSGLVAAALTPGGFIGILAAIVTMVYFNRKLSVDRPIETQLKEIFQQIKSGGFFKEVRQSWNEFESFLSQLIHKKPERASYQ